MSACEKLTKTVSKRVFVIHILDWKIVPESRNSSRGHKGCKNNQRSHATVILQYKKVHDMMYVYCHTWKIKESTHYD